MGRLEILCTRFRHTPFRSSASWLVRTITVVVWLLATRFHATA